MLGDYYTMQEEEILDEDIIEETPEYSHKSEFNKPKMAEAVILRALELRAKPMRPSYINTSVSSDGTIKREFVEDSRQAYVNAVKACLVTLAPEIKRWKDNAKVNELVTKYSSIFKDYCYEELDQFAKPSLTSNQWIITKTGNKFIPENDQVVCINQVEPNRPGFIKGQLVKIKGYWNTKTNAYWDAMIAISDEILGQLQILVDSLNYFKQGLSF